VRTIFALLGAAVGYGIGVFVSDLVCAAIGVPSKPVEMPAALIILACGAAFCVLGIRLASRLGGRGRRMKAFQKWQAMLAALGTAFGPVIGYFAAYCLNPEAKSDGHVPVELARLFFGAPLGTLLFCLLGLYVGGALDGWSQRQASRTESSDSA